MKDIDELLRQSQPRPKRDLSPDFVAQIVDELKLGSNSNKKGQKIMKQRLSPVLAGIIATVIIISGGGVAYAGTDGFTKPFELNNIFGYKSINQKDGRNVLAVKTTGCSVGAVDKPGGEADKSMYFKVKDSSVVDADVLRWVQGYCEYTNDSGAMKRLYEASQKVENTIIGGVISAIDGDIFTVTSQNNSTGDNRTVTERIKVDTDSETVKGAGIGNNIVPGIKLTAVILAQQYDEKAINHASLAVFGSINSVYYQTNADRFNSVLERVQPCGNNFCKYTDEVSAVDVSATSRRALAAVKQAYDEYNKRLNSAINPEDYENAESTFFQNTTPELESKIRVATSYDPVFCAQNILPSQLTYGSPTILSDSVVVPVLRPELVSESASGKQEFRQVAFADVTYSIKQQKISSIDCNLLLPQ